MSGKNSETQYSARERLADASTQANKLYNAAVVLQLELRKFLEETGVLNRSEKSAIKYAMGSTDNIANELHDVSISLNHSVDTFGR